MPNTPGEVNYEAWRAMLLHTVGYWSLAMHLPWCDLRPVEQHAWDAAAEAVLEACASLCPLCGAELDRCNRKGDHDA